MEDYDVLGQLGRGASGVVFRVFHRPSKQEHAMKVIRCADQSQMNFALKEIKVLLQLRNPHIVSYIDFFVLINDDFLIPPGLATSSRQSSLAVCLVMELCQHQNLDDRIKEAKRHFMEHGIHLIKEDQITSWILQAAEALKYIHDRGFLHRDMKPTNVFFSKHGNVKLGDFGLATSAGIGKESTVGSPHYFAPELLLHQTYNFKVDVWGLGVVILELLTFRERPINAELIANPLEVESVVKDIMSMGFSINLATLIRDMLCRNPDGRPSPAAIIQRLSKKTVPTELCAPKLTAVVCALCEVDPAVVNCNQCEAAYCASCNTTRHRHASRGSHIRTQLVLSSNLGSARSLLPKLRDNAVLEIRVPGTYPSIDEAILRLKGSKERTVRIFVESGFHQSKPFVISELSHNLEIVGADPNPVVEFRTRGVAIQLSHGKGQIKNLIFVHTPGDEERIADEPRPCTIEILGGMWSINNCRVSSRVGSGIVASGNDTCPSIQDCQLVEMKHAGILFNDGAAGTVVGCTISACEYAGILSKKGSKPHIQQCMVCDGKETGVYCHESSPVIENCTIKSNSGCGIVVKGSTASPTVSSTKICDNGLAGIVCCDESSPTIQDNEITGSFKAGIIVKTGSNPLTRRNTVTNGREAGVFVFDGGRGRFEENSFSGNANAGVLVTTSASVIFTSNSIRRNGYEGVWVCKGGGGTFVGNDVRNNSRGPKDVEAGCTVQWTGNRED